MDRAPPLPRGTGLDGVAEGTGLGVVAEGTGLGGVAEAEGTGLGWMGSRPNKTRRMVLFPLPEGPIQRREG